MRMDFSKPINFSNDGQDSRVTVVLTPNERVRSNKELDSKYGPGNWVIKYEGFENQSSPSAQGLVNPENTRRRVW